MYGDAVVYARGTWRAIAAEHISYVGRNQRWVRVRDAAGPVERLCTWDEVRLVWELP